MTVITCVYLAFHILFQKSNHPFKTFCSIHSLSIRIIRNYVFYLLNHMYVIGIKMHAVLAYVAYVTTLKCIKLETVSIHLMQYSGAAMSQKFGASILPSFPPLPSSLSASVPLYLHPSLLSFFPSLPSHSSVPLFLSLHSFSLSQGPYHLKPARRSGEHSELPQWVHQMVSGHFEVKNRPLVSGDSSVK